MSRIVLSIFVAGATLAVAAPPAAACGGLFCNAVEPVLQTAERILFVVDETPVIPEVTTVVEIQFEGAASEFGWVLPVPRVLEPEDVSTAPAGLFDALEEATALQFISDTTADAMSVHGAPAGCFVPPLWLLEPSPRGGVAEEPTFDGVEVVGEAVVGPYAIEIITADDASQLTGWLQFNNYAIPASAAEPIAHYVSSGGSFLGLKLRPDVPEGPIDALQFTYSAPAPSLPLLLTAIAAAPDMDITAYVVANDRYVPAGWSEADVDMDTVSFTEDGTDYEQRLAQAVDDAGGNAFHTEFAGPTEWVSAGGAASEILARGTYLTRMRTLVSPEEMTSDPIWVADTEAPDVGNIRMIPGGTAVAMRAPARPLRASSAGLLFGVPLLLGFRRRL